MKVLITSLSAGSGHVRAAEAVLAAFRRTAPEVEVAHVDVADFVTPQFRRLYVEGYRVAVNKTPRLWGRFYHYWDGVPPEGTILPLLHRTQRACAGRFFTYLHNFRPDRILTTHFLVPQLLTTSPHMRCLNPLVETIITDYDVHRFWISDVVSRYYLGHESMTEALMRYGVQRSSIVASGIPVHPVFSEPIAPSTIFQSLSLDAQRPVVLMLSGGLGLHELQKAVERLLTLPQPLQIISVAGKNELLRKRLSQLKVPAHMTLVNLGYVRNMQELLTISSVVITKPGGLTVSECLAKMKPMILFSPIPGQEEKNAEFLETQQAALRARSLDEIPGLVQSLLTDRPLRDTLLTNMKSCARPQAAYTIAETITRASRLAA